MYYIEAAIVRCHSEIENKRRQILSLSKAIKVANKDLHNYICKWIASDFFLTYEIEKHSGPAMSYISINSNLNDINQYFDVTEVFRGLGVSLYGKIELLCDCKGQNKMRLFGLYDDIDRVFDYLVKRKGVKSDLEQNVLK